MSSETSPEAGSSLASMATKRRNAIRQRRFAKTATDETLPKSPDSDAQTPESKRSTSTGRSNTLPKKKSPKSQTNARPASAPRERTDEENKGNTSTRLLDRLARVKHLQKNASNRIVAKGSDGSHVERSLSLTSSQSDASPQKSLSSQVVSPTAEQEATNTSAAFDFRTLGPEENLAVEASWDANKVLFNEFQEDSEKKPDDALNVFEGDWTDDNHVEFSKTLRMNEAEDDIPSPPSRGRDTFDEEEKKEKEILVPQVESPVDAPRIEVDIFGWPKVKVEEAEEREAAAEMEVCDGDDENLLGCTEDDDDVDKGCTEDDNDVDKPRVSKEERLEQYNAVDMDDNSSRHSDDDDDEEIEDDIEDDFDSDANIDEVVAYVAQESTDADDEIVESSKAEHLDFVPSVEAAAQFEVPAQQQFAKETRPLQSPPRRSSGLPPLGTSSRLIPPPPPPPGSKKMRKKKKTKPGGAASLLLPPPPAEKLKKWEEEKARPKKYLNEIKLAKDSGDVEITSEQIFATSFDATLSEPEPSPTNSEESSKTPKRSGSHDKNMSPASSSVVLNDVKMAEKVDVAISAASSKFEEQVLKSPARESSPARSGGAFSSWNQPLGSSSADSGFQEGKELSQQDKSDDLSPKNLTASLESIEVTEAQSRAHVTEPSPRFLFPDGYPSPFELTVTRKPLVISQILDFLGDPVMVCRMKMLNKSCFDFVNEHEYRLIRDSVRLGGMNMHVRPYFWLWVALEKSTTPEPSSEVSSLSDMPHLQLPDLERRGREGKWHSVIERDVTRSFGNLPPHKTGARLRTDSIVRALVSWGRCRMLKRGVKGDGQHLAPPQSLAQEALDSEMMDIAPTDTVSDWGGVAPVGSFASLEVEESMQSKMNDANNTSVRHDQSIDGKSIEGELALNGNALTDSARDELQGKLSCILHALAASHEDVGYCQGMDYIVAHLLRILQETVRWKGAIGTLPGAIKSAPVPLHTPPFSPEILSHQLAEVDRTPVVEETCFRMMECFFTTYSLRHFYYPELRCLKTCCRVFEKLIQLKLPVLADHFEHHELNVGLFALGWFQTLFLYLPSMPSATVCHMWDIWLVERSYKIFFRVGTAILFLSQPILLNHELEGMMSYLNTFPDATLLSPDILIACALQIKVTTRMLMDLERECAAKPM